MQATLIEELVRYISHGISTLSVETPDNTIAIHNILGEFQKKWEALPCAPEGATKEQDKAMDDLLDSTADEIIKLL